MTDRELLELAAKAVGIVLEYDGNPKEWQPMYYQGKTYHSWNPLEYDGDALRLAVNLNLTIAIEAESAGVVEISWDFDEGGCAQSSIEEIAPAGGDDYAATRRAIVRAAAEIGKGK